MRLFGKSVDEAIADLNKAAKNLLAASDYHDKQATNIGMKRIVLQEQMNFHSHEADRAIRIHGKINELIS